MDIVGMYVYSIFHVIYLFAFLLISAVTLHLLKLQYLCMCLIMFVCLAAQLKVD